MTDKDSSWHLNKSVPLALIFTIFIQSAGAVWWASSINESVTNLDLKVDVLTAVQADERRELEAENLRQWARINGAERTIQQTSAALDTLTAILTRLEAQVKDNNDLLKEYLRGSGNRP